MNRNFNLACIYSILFFNFASKRLLMSSFFIALFYGEIQNCLYCGLIMYLSIRRNMNYIINQS
jgi:hypothetical protein